MITPADFGTINAHACRGWSTSLLVSATHDARGIIDLYLREERETPARAAELIPLQLAARRALSVLERELDARVPPRRDGCFRRALGHAANVLLRGVGFPPPIGGFVRRG